MSVRPTGSGKGADNWMMLADGVLEEVDTDAEVTDATDRKQQPPLEPLPPPSDSQGLSSRLAPQALPPLQFVNPAAEPPPALNQNSPPHTPKELPVRTSAPPPPEKQHQQPPEPFNLESPPPRKGGHCCTKFLDWICCRRRAQKDD